MIWRILALAALVVAACGPAPSGTGTAGTSAPAASAGATKTAAPTESPVTVAVGVPSNILNAPFYLGAEKGIFLKHGIDLKLSTVNSGPDAVKAIQGGQIQVSALAWATIVPVVAQGLPLRLFCPVIGGPNIGNYDTPLAIIVRPGLTASGVADLKGLTIATPFGGAPELYLRTRLKSAGLDPDKDVKLVNITFPNELSAMQSKAADAVMSTEPYGVLILKQVAGSRVLVRGGGLSDNRITLGALGPWIAQNPKVVDQMTAAHLESLQYVRLHPDEAAQSTSRYLTGLDQSVLTDALKLIDFDPRWSDKVLQSFASASQSLVANGTLKVAPNPADILVLDRLTGIERTYPQYLSDLN